MEKNFRRECNAIPFRLSTYVSPKNQLITGKTRDEWVEYLKDSNCDLSVVPWIYLDNEWSRILAVRPDLVDKIDFKTMPIRDISWLMDHHFMLIKDKIPRERMPKRDYLMDRIFNEDVTKYDCNQYDWGQLTYEHPVVIEYCKPEKITDPAAVGKIIRRHKRLAKYFSPSMLKRAQQYNAAWEKYQTKMKNKKRYNPGDIIEFPHFSDENPDFCRRIKAFVIAEYSDEVHVEPMYTCVMLDPDEMKIIVHDEPQMNLRLIERTNKTMLEYFGWDYSSICKDECPETITITLNDQLITNYYNKSWNNYDTSKQALIIWFEKELALEYNKEYTLEVSRKMSKNWYSVKSINNRYFGCPVDY